MTITVHKLTVATGFSRFGLDCREYIHYYAEWNARLRMHPKEARLRIHPVSMSYVVFCEFKCVVLCFLYNPLTCICGCQGSILSWKPRWCDIARMKMMKNHYLHFNSIKLIKTYTLCMTLILEIQYILTREIFSPIFKRHDTHVSCTTLQEATLSQ